MPEDVVTLRADGSQYFDVLSRAGVAADRLSGSGDRIGTGFLRGDRAVRVATQNITQGLLSANNAADAALITFQSLERVFRIPIASTVGIAAAVAGVSALRNEMKKTQDAVEAARMSLRVPLEIQAQLSPEDIATRIEAITKTTRELEKQIDSAAQKIVRFFAGPLGSTSGAMRKQISDQIEENEARVSALATARADKELEIARNKHEQLEAEKEGGDILKAQVEFDQQRAKLMEEFITKGGNLLDFYKRFLAAQFTLNDAIAKGAQALGEMAEKAMLKLGTTVKGFFQDVGSGQFVKNLGQQRLEQQQQQRGKDIVAELQAARDQGIPLGPNAQAILNEADNISKSAGVGVNDLAQLDFTNLEQLSKYDFSGLDALNGLTIAIQ